MSKQPRKLKCKGQEHSLSNRRAFYIVCLDTSVQEGIPSDSVPHTDSYLEEGLSVVMTALVPEITDSVTTHGLVMKSLRLLPQPRFER